MRPLPATVCAPAQRAYGCGRARVISGQQVAPVHGHPAGGAGRGMAGPAIDRPDHGFPEEQRARTNSVC